MAELSYPYSKEALSALKAGDRVYICGTLFTARDAAHKKLAELIAEGRPLPLDLSQSLIYYAGPCPAAPGKVIGSCGPTTSGRMDVYTPTLLELGLLGTIGKGERSEAVVNAIKKNRAPYFAAVGGAGALLSKCVTAAEVVAFPELGTEAIRKLTVKNFPVIVAIDAMGNSLYR